VRRRRTTWAAIIAVLSGARDAHASSRASPFRKGAVNEDTAKPALHFGRALFAAQPRGWEAQGIVGPGPANLTDHSSQRIGGSFTFNSSSRIARLRRARNQLLQSSLDPAGTVTSCSLSLDSANPVDSLLGIGGADDWQHPAPGEYASTEFAQLHYGGYYLTQFPRHLTLCTDHPRLRIGSVTVVVLGYSDSPGH